MTDDLERLKAALRETPAPEAERRAEALRLAMESFDSHQETAQQARPTSETSRRSGGLMRVREMLNSLSSRQALAMGGSVAALCLGLVVVLPALREQPVPVLPPAVLKPDAPVVPRSDVAVPRKEPALQDYGKAEANTAAPEADLRDAETSADLQASDAATDYLAEAPAPMAPVGGAVSAKRAATTSGETMAEPLMELAPSPQSNTEAFANADRNGPQATAQNPVSTFSIDVDTASYGIVRSSLMGGSLPPPDAVRIEEMVNYFPYAYSAPDAGDAFRPDIEVIPTPWNPQTRLVRIGVQGALPALADRPPLNLVFLIDTSGSMEDANKLPLLRQGFRLMLGQLRPEDKVAIVTYAGSAGEVLAPTPASDRATILAALDRLSAGGGTNGQAGLEQAYAEAERMAGEGRVSRVILATDGDFNLGLDDPEALEEFIAAKRKTGTYLSVLGFGRGNLDDATMQALAQTGNGTAAYIDTLQEAQKVLVDQLTGALFPIADDVKIQIEWNATAVAEWRLIGYETRALNRADFSNDKVDAGEIGAGTAMTALYEVTPPGSPALRNEPLRYGTTADSDGKADELGFLRLRWKAPGGAVSSLVEEPIPVRTEGGSDDTRFAAAIAGFGQLLTGGTYLGDWGWQEAIALASSAKGVDTYGYRGEAIGLMRLAQSLSVR